MKKIVYLLAAVLLSVEIAGAAVPMKTYAATTGTVNTSALNVRSGASTGHSRIGLIYQGATVTILGSSGNWYQISANINGTTKTGYVYKDYIKVSSGSSSGGGSTNGQGSGGSGSGKVNVSGLNVRSGPSTSSSILGSISSGTTVTILESSGQWYKISVNLYGNTVTAYVFAQYITRTSDGGSSGNNGGSTNGSGSTNGGSGTVTSEARERSIQVL